MTFEYYMRKLTISRRMQENIDKENPSRKLIY